jgi:hypothetical protein
MEIINDRKEILALAGYGLYQSELEEKLHLYKSENHRSHWKTKDLDTYIRKRISTAIVDNEFILNKNPKTKRKNKPKTDKEMIVLLAEELFLEILAVKHVYNEVKEDLHLGGTKDDDRNFITAQLYAHLDDLDLRIEEAVEEKDKQKWYELKMKTIDQFTKIKNLEDKPANNTAIVHGNVNTQNNTNVDKQIVISEQEAMLKILKGLNVLKGQ